MSTFRCDLSGASPLQLRLSTVFGGAMAELQEWSAEGENAIGQTSRPQLYRPSLPGISRASGETAVVSCLNRPGLVTPTCQVASVFSLQPSLPDAPKTSGNLPFRAEGRWSRGYGLKLLPVAVSQINPLRSENCIILYARTIFLESSAGTGLDASSVTQHTWSGSVVWEEI